MNNRIAKAISASVILIASLLVPLDHAAAAVCVSSKSSFVGNGTIGLLNAVYTVESFTSVVSNCTWTVPSNVSKVDALVIGGGGGGGTWVSGGGGAGGMMDTTSISVTPNASILISVGAGGAGATRSITTSISAVTAYNGGASNFGSYSVDGGGYGGSWTDASGQNGGSGGGGSNGAGGISTNSLYGYSGGSGNSDGNYGYPSGGGGGAGGNGANAASNVSGMGKSGDGGAGRSSTITGTSVTYAGGGGAGCHGNTPYDCVVGSGGSGGGGSGDKWISSTHQVTVGGNGLANTGSGGGGAGVPNNTAFNPSSATGGSGGSGLVVVRYISDLKLNFSLGTGSITSTSTTYRTSTQMNVNAPVSGKVTFLQFGKRIPGCINLNAVAGSTVTCNWKPSYHGQIPITLNYYQTGVSGIFKSASFIFSTIKRANNR